MRYLLTMLTNGRRDVFERALAACATQLHPGPAGVAVMDDGGQTTAAGLDIENHVRDTFPGVPVTVESSPQPLGMCRAHAYCWRAAAASPHDWVFHHEDDQLILRPTDLNDLREVLETQPHLEQIALVRAPWGAEIPHGGYIPQAPGWYRRCGDGSHEWIETTRNWATSPALFRTSLTRTFPWPEDPGCETTIGPQIREARPNAMFALWGAGECWYSHIGVDRTAGSYGY